MCCSGSTASPARRAVKPPSEKPPPSAPTGLRLARFATGALTALTGVVALFVVGMAYRALADSRLDGAFVVATFLVGGVALGGVMTAMLLGHWYLNTPTASGKPLEFATIVMLGALALELIFSLAIGPSTAHSTLKPVNVAPGTQITTGGGTVVISTPTLAPGQTAPATTDAGARGPTERGIRCLACKSSWASSRRWLSVAPRSG